MNTDNARKFNETIRDLPEEEKRELWNKRLTGDVVNFGEIIVDNRYGCASCIFVNQAESERSKKFVCIRPGGMRIKNGKCTRRYITSDDNFKSVTILVLSMMSALVLAVVLFNLL